MTWAHGCHLLRAFPVRCWQDKCEHANTRHAKCEHEHAMHSSTCKRVRTVRTVRTKKQRGPIPRPRKGCNTNAAGGCMSRDALGRKRPDIQTAGQPCKGGCARHQAARAGPSPLSGGYGHGERNFLTDVQIAIGGLYPTRGTLWALPGQSRHG